MRKTSVQTAHGAQILIPAKKAVPADILPLDYAIWQGDVAVFLKGLPVRPVFDLIVTSPPYNLGQSCMKNRVG